MTVHHLIINLIVFVIPSLEEYVILLTELEILKIIMSIADLVILVQGASGRSITLNRLYHPLWSILYVA